MAKVREIEVYLGLSIDKGGTWIKPAMGIKIELDDNEWDDLDNRKPIIQRAFDILDENLDDRLKKLLDDEVTTPSPED